MAVLAVLLVILTGVYLICRRNKRRARDTDDAVSSVFAEKVLTVAKC